MKFLKFCRLAQIVSCKQDADSYAMNKQKASHPARCVFNGWGACFGSV